MTAHRRPRPLPEVLLPVRPMCSASFSAHLERRCNPQPPGAFNQQRYLVELEAGEARLEALPGLCKWRNIPPRRRVLPGCTRGGAHGSASRQKIRMRRNLPCAGCRPGLHAFERGSQAEPRTHGEYHRAGRSSHLFFAIRKADRRWNNSDCQWENHRRRKPRQAEGPG